MRFPRLGGKHGDSTIDFHIAGHFGCAPPAPEPHAQPRPCERGCGGLGNTMKRLFSTAAMTIALSMAPATAGAHPFIVDQHNDGFVPPFFQNIQLLGPMGQEFTPSLAFLDVVELYTADMVSNDGGAALQLNIRALTIFGAILGTSLVVPLADGFFGVTHFDFPVPVPLVPGGIFVIEALVVAGQNWGVGSSGDESYPGGDQIVHGASFPDNDLWFREGLASAAEPPALLLLGSGLVVLGVVGWLRQFRFAPV